MKFFAAVKLATFADELLKAVGLDLTALAAAGDKEALKTALAAKSGIAEAESALAEAVKENEELTAKLDAALKFKADADKFVALSAAVKGAGLNPDEPAKIEEQQKAAVAKGARLMVAKAGHPGIIDDIAPEPATKQPKKQKDPNAAEPVGRDRMAKAFQAQANRFMRNEAEGRS